MEISRRRALALFAGGAAVAAGGLGAAWRELRPAPGPGPDAMPTSSPGALAGGTFASRACGREVAWQLALPPGASERTGLPVALVLHGRGGDVSAAFAQLHLDGFLAEVVTAGTPPFALASVDGGDHSYWHRRATGEDPQAMLLEEYLPLLASRGLRTERFGAFGWSMGGYGALLLAQTLAQSGGPQRVAAVAASSPALWSRARDTADGAFDDAKDFAAHDVVGHPQQLAGVPVRLACGDDDPFAPVTHAFAPTVPDLAGTDFGPGSHTRGYWRATAAGQLRFLGEALAGV
ncbi:alpha/beta hydrolase [Quadrisphaera granulorum]|uniref:alpha/beta hydrolase n=1 Tax=Quadrisphaera granulorum TaxID=317664 RepID=UPI001B85CC22|nr:alpha/beta hydrolase-fold protein [Quadrisphaera granulorum]